MAILARSGRTSEKVSHGEGLGRPSHPPAPVRLGGLFAFRRDVLPRVHREWRYWRRAAEAEPDLRIRALALDSLEAKRFHCEGGAVLALLVPQDRQRGPFIRALCAIQTLSDVLDSLTDRPPDGRPLRSSEIFALHQAFVAAVTGLGLPKAEESEVPFYVRRLVACAVANLRRLPRLALARPFLLRLGFTYSVMQALKHISPRERRTSLEAWARRLSGACPDLGARPWAEVTACAGSTLGMFRLMAWAAVPEENDPAIPELVLARYHPSLCSLHILLDGAIDLEEDAVSDDLNVFRALTEPATAPGPIGDLLASARRVRRLAREARHDLRQDPLGSWLVDGLFAAYLSDPKARMLPAKLRRHLARTGGMRALVMELWVKWQTRRGALGKRVPQIARVAGEDASPRLHDLRVGSGSGGDDAESAESAENAKEAECVRPLGAIGKTASPGTFTDVTDGGFMGPCSIRRTGMGPSRDETD